MPFISSLAFFLPSSVPLHLFPLFYHPLCVLECPSCIGLSMYFLAERKRPVSLDWP